MARRLPGRPLFVVFLFVATVAHAEEAVRDTVYALPGVTVEERRLALERAAALRPGFSALYRLSETPSPTTTATEILSQAVGVHVRQFGGLNAYSAVSVRGSDATQVAVYLDGVPLNQAQYGVVSASDLPLAALERIEVYRGGSPVGFGNPGAAVINLVTRDEMGAASATRLSYGSFDTRRAQSWGSWTRGPARVFGAYEFRASRGAFGFLDDNGTPKNLADDEWTKRLNNAFTSSEGTGKVDWALGAPGRLTLAADLLTKEGGMPGLSQFQSDHAHRWTDRGVASLTWRWARRALELSTQTFGVRARDRLLDAEGDLGAGKQDSDDRTYTWGVRPQAALTAGPLEQSLTLVAEARREEYHPTAVLPTPRSGPTSRRAALVFGAEERIEPWRGRLSLTASARREAGFDDFPAGPPYPGAPPRSALARTTRFTQRSAGARLALAAGLVVRANASIQHRLPSLFELFGDRGSVLGNRGLKPERLDSWDAGLSWSCGPASAEASFYRTDARDLIVFIQNSQNTSVAQNVTAARLEGVEVTGNGRHRGLALVANWTYQNARDHSGIPYWEGRELPARPRHEIFTRFEAKRGHAQVFYEFQYTSANFLDRANLAPVGVRRLHGAGASWTWARDRFRLTAEGKNLGDDRIQDAVGYPLPGRVLAASLDVRL